MSESTQHNTKEAMDWYRNVGTKNPPFNPNGMCLAICRTARNIGPLWPSAVSASVHTPEDQRVHKVSDVRRGMVAFFDDPHDSNPFGHIVSVVGRAKGEDPDTLRSLIVYTNSVVSGKIVAVRGDYFGRHWGDSFQFAATYLNGEPFYDMQPHDRPKVKPKTYPNVEETIAKMEEGIDTLSKAIHHHDKAGHTHYAHAMKRDRKTMQDTVKHLKATYKKHR